MSSTGNFIIRRGTEMLSTQLQHRDESHKPQWLQFSIFIFTILIGVVAVVASLCAAYICGLVTLTLAAVEDTNTNAYVRLESHDSSDSFDTSDVEDLSKPTTEPITAGLFSTLRYLRARGGIWSCFRGFRAFLAFAGGSEAAVLLFALIPPIPGPLWITTSIWGFLSGILFATWKMAWVHVVIADKSPKTSYRRMLGYQHWPKIAPAAVLYYATTCVVLAPLNLIQRFGFSSATNTSSGAIFKLDLQATAGSILYDILFTFLCLPVEVIFIRVAASMLPGEAEPIVQFDRTFGGKVKHESVGGSGSLSIKDAWTTWKWSARVSCLMMLLKSHAVQAVIFAVAIPLMLGLVALNTAL